MTAPAPHRGKNAAQAEVAQRRRAARVAAVQALYEHDMTGAALEDVIREFLNDRWLRRVVADEEEDGADRPAAPEFHRDLFIDVVRGASSRQGAIDEMLNAALAPARSAERLEAILRAILRAGIYEIADRRTVPARVVIDEYVAIAGGFYAGKEPGLVNAVLDRLAWTLRPDELEAAKGGRPAPER